MSPLPFDHPGYAAAFAHLGVARSVDGWCAPLVERRISGTDAVDAMGPWPYSTLPVGEAAARAIEAARVAGWVAVGVVGRPDVEPDAAALAQAGFELVPLKPHFARRPGGPDPASTKAIRANVRRARRDWRVREVDVATARPYLGPWHDALAAERGFSKITAVPPAHYDGVASVPGMRVLLAEDDAGPAAAFSIAAAPEGDTAHGHTIAGDARAYRGAFYALYDALIEGWGATRTIWFGGAPGGPAGPGVARFKRRFANHSAPAWHLRATLDPERAAALAQTRGAPGWFPPYRGPAD